MHLIKSANGERRHVIPGRSPFSGELEVKDEVQAVISWDKRVYRLRTRKGDHNISGVTKPGIYLVERDRKPVYVGIVHKRNSTIGQRWKCRVDTFRQLKIPSETERRYSIRVGTIQGKGGWLTRIRKDLYESVERVLIRYLKKVPGYGLTNQMSRLPFTVAKAGISIENRAAKPPYLPQAINRRAGQTLELTTPRPRDYRNGRAKSWRRAEKKTKRGTVDTWLGEIIADNQLRAP